MLPVNLQKHRKQITQIARRYGARNIRVFGSYARGDATTTSDLDLLVDLAPGKSLFDLGGMLYEIGQALGIPVDILNEDSLDPDFRDRIKRDAIPL